MNNNSKYIEYIFDTISYKYDFINNILSLGLHNLWRKKSYNILNKYFNNYKYILDVGIGTGDMSYIFLTNNPLCRIIGIDISKNMLNITCNKLYKYSNRINLLHANIESNDLSNIYSLIRYFDIIVFVFTLRNIININNMLLELKKILKLYGWIFIIEFKYPIKGIMRYLYKYYSKYMCFMGSFLSKNLHAYEHLNKSIKNFSNFSIRQIFNNNGFETCHVQYIFLDIVKLYLFKKLY